MRGAQTVAESGLAGEETAIDQAAVDVTDDDAARVEFHSRRRAQP